jgi:hypothetical protein
MAVFQDAFWQAFEIENDRKTGGGVAHINFNIESLKCTICHPVVRPGVKKVQQFGNFFDVAAKISSQSSLAHFCDIFAL